MTCRPPFPVGHRVSVVRDMLSIYVNAVEDGRYLLAQYAGRLGRAKLGSAVVSFTHPADLDLDTLAGLLDRTSLLTLPDR
jgi:hypothetical protein